MELFDYIIVGSGFGGSVAALRLAEKGYRVAVLEEGRRFAPGDFPKTNWDLRRYLFAPRLGLNGIMRLNFFKRLMVLSGAGVGGGSLVYANTLMQPTDFSSWPKTAGPGDWESVLAPHYETARRMLGATRAPNEFPADRMLRDAATELGYGDSFSGVDVAVYLGEAGTEVEDPYFQGAGPRRAGCTLCGGCMVGCRYNAKNTLDKNYLYLAEGMGTHVIPETKATRFRREDDGHFTVFTKPSRSLFIGERPLMAKNLVLAAGVMGTLEILHRSRSLVPALDSLGQHIGESVRTNNESIMGVRFPAGENDYSKGLAITSSVRPNQVTKIEQVRYSEGSDAMGVFAGPVLRGTNFPTKLWSFLCQFIARPGVFFQMLRPRGFARDGILLLVMQSLDGRIRLKWARNWLLLKGLRSRPDPAAPSIPGGIIPEGEQMAQQLARRFGGEPGASITDLFGMGVTAHILGGCPMGQDPSSSLIDENHQVHGIEGLLILGAAAIPANLGVNPSLTITAMAERVCAGIPPSDLTTHSEEDVNRGN